MRVLLVGLLLATAAATPARADSLAFVGVSGTVARDGDVLARSRGVVFGATSGDGAGIEVRWVADAPYQIATASFLQAAPGPARGKTVQPYGAAGIALIRASGDQAIGVHVSGGVIGERRRPARVADAAPRVAASHSDATTLTIQKSHSGT